MTKGKVYLVGAGPGDVGLFTIKGKRVLEEADVVVYDRLVGHGVLSMIPLDAECIDVGKRAGTHTMPQEEINQLLLQRAMKGKKVVRLKGGDPFLFGRGGEELQLLYENEIDFEIVPGITSSLAVPAYQGIPVTHRDYCSSVHIVTGHQKKNAIQNVNYEALVNTKGTLVFLMGVSALHDICQNLMVAGMEPSMPAAILQQGTTACQKRIVATVSTLFDEVQKQGVVTPAIIIVGKVCHLAEHFCWYDNLKLAGKKVLITRPRELNSKMAIRLRSLGAEVVELPMVSLEPLALDQRMKNMIEDIAEFDWLVFTSPSAVKIFLERYQECKMDVRKMACKIAVIGPGTKRVLSSYGIIADFMPSIYEGKVLGEELGNYIVEHDGFNTSKVFIPIAQNGGDDLIRMLHERQLEVTKLVLYRTIHENKGIVDIKKELEKNQMTCAVFTSASCVEGFQRVVGSMDYANVTAACIGPKTFEAARRLGMTCQVSKEATIDSLVELVQEL